MTDLRLSAREVEDVLAGRQPDGRADLAALAEVAAVLHASREVEPAPPMSEALRAQIDRGVLRPAAAPTRRRRHRPRHLQAVAPRRTGLATYRRPVVSVAAAAAVLIGLVLATNGGHLPRDVHSAVADVSSAIGLDLFRGDDAAGPDKPAPTTSSTSTTTTTAPTTTAPPPSTTTAPPPTTQAPVGPPPADHQLPWWLSPEFWQQYGDGDWSGGGWDGDGRGDDYGRDGDRDGDGDGTGTGSGSGHGQPGRAGPYDQGTGTTVPPSTAAPTSTSTSAAPATTGSPPTT